MYLRIWKTRPGQEAACAGRHSLHMPAPCACVQCRQYWLFSFFFTVPFLTLPGWQRQPWCSNSAAVKSPESQGSGPWVPGSGGGSGSAAAAQLGSGSAGSVHGIAAAVEGWLSTTTQPRAPAESQASPLSLGPAALAWSCLALHASGVKVAAECGEQTPQQQPVSDGTPETAAVGGCAAKHARGRALTAYAVTAPLANWLLSGQPARDPTEQQSHSQWALQHRLAQQRGFVSRGGGGVALLLLLLLQDLRTGGRGGGDAAQPAAQLTCLQVPPSCWARGSLRTARTWANIGTKEGISPSVQPAGCMVWARLGCGETRYGADASAQGRAAIDV